MGSQQQQQDARYPAAIGRTLSRKAKPWQTDPHQRSMAGSQDGTGKHNAHQTSAKLGALSFELTVLLRDGRILLRDGQVSSVQFSSSSARRAACDAAARALDALSSSEDDGVVIDARLLLLRG